MPRVLNKYKDNIPPDAVYIGRPSKWGNPFSMNDSRSREEVVELYSQWITNQTGFIYAVIDELRGKDLVCFCAPKVCHGDILLHIANDKTII